MGQEFSVAVGGASTRFLHATSTFMAGLPELRKLQLFPHGFTCGDPAVKELVHRFILHESLSDAYFYWKSSAGTRRGTRMGCPNC